MLDAFANLLPVLSGRKVRLATVAASCDETLEEEEDVGGAYRHALVDYFAAPAPLLDGATALGDSAVFLRPGAGDEGATRESFWRTAKVAFPGGSDFVWRDVGSHGGKVAVDGARPPGSCGRRGR